MDADLALALALSMQEDSAAAAPPAAQTAPHEAYETAMYASQPCTLALHDDDAGGVYAAPEGLRLGEAISALTLADKHGAYDPAPAGLTTHDGGGGGSDESSPPAGAAVAPAAPAAGAGEEKHLAASVPRPLAPPPPLVPDLASHVRSWNEELGNIMSVPVLTQEDGLQRVAALARLSRAFAAACTPIASTLVAELAVPDEAKSIRPLDVGGVAGGTKYRVCDVLFKFAVDSSGLYGGSDAQAGKAAKAELRGLQGVVTAAVPGLRFPLQCVIDVLGHRVAALCLLPIGGDTLVYGSADGGRSVHADEPTLNSALQQLGQRLNLAPHLVSGVEVVMAGDVEGHIGRDGHAVVIDTARMWPPEAPATRLHGTVLGAGGTAVEVAVQPAQAGAQVGEALLRCLAAEAGCATEELLTALPAPQLVAQQLPHAQVVLLALAPGQVAGTGCAAAVVAAAAAPNARAAGLWGTEGAPPGPVLVLSVPPTGSHLTQLLRANAVAASPVPLSADAFTGWGATDAPRHNAAVRAATDAVLAGRLGQLALQLVSEASDGRLVPAVAVRPAPAEAAAAPDPLFALGQEFLPAYTKEGTGGAAVRSALAATGAGAAAPKVPGPLSPALASMGYGVPATEGLAYGAPARAVAVPLTAPPALTPCADATPSKLGVSLRGLNHRAAPEVDWKARLHGVGANCRHLGRLRHIVCTVLTAHAEAIDALPSETRRTLALLPAALLAYGVARVFYVDLRAALRAVSAEERGGVEAGTPAATVAARATARAQEVARSLFDQRLQYSRPETGDSPAARLRLKAALAGKYAGLLQPEEWADDVSVWAALPYEARVYAFGVAQRLTGAQVQFFVVEGVETCALAGLQPRLHSLQPPPSRGAGDGTEASGRIVAMTSPATLRDAVAGAVAEAVRRQRTPGQYRQRGLALLRLAASMQVYDGAARAAAPAVHAAAHAALGQALACALLRMRRASGDSGLLLEPSAPQPRAAAVAAQEAVTATLTQGAAAALPLEARTVLLAALQVARLLADATEGHLQAAQLASDHEDAPTAAHAALRCEAVGRLALATAAQLRQMAGAAATTALDAAVAGVRARSLPAAGDAARAGVFLALLARKAHRTACRAGLAALAGMGLSCAALLALGHVPAAAQVGNAAAEGPHAAVTRGQAEHVAARGAATEALDALQAACEGAGSSVAALLRAPSSDGRWPVWLPMASLSPHSLAAAAGRHLNLGRVGGQALEGALLEAVNGDMDDPWQLAVQGYRGANVRADTTVAASFGAADSDLEGAEPSTRSVAMLVSQARLLSALARAQDANFSMVRSRSRLAHVASLCGNVQVGTRVALELNLQQARGGVAMGTEQWLPHTAPPMEALRALEEDAGPDEAGGAHTAIAGLRYMLAACAPGAALLPASLVSSPSSVGLAGLYPQQEGDGGEPRVGQMTAPARGTAGGGVGVVTNMSHHATNALRSGESSLGARHPGMATAHVSMADVGLLLGKWHNAHRHALRALALRLPLPHGRIWPHTHGTTAVLGTLAALAARARQYAVALAWAAATSLACVGGDCEPLLRALRRVGGDACAAGSMQDAAVMTPAVTAALAPALALLCAVDPMAIPPLRRAAGAHAQLRMAALLAYHVAPGVAGTVEAWVTQLVAGEAGEVVEVLAMRALHCAALGAVGRADTLPPLPEDIAERVAAVAATSGVEAALSTLRGVWAQEQVSADALAREVDATPWALEGGWHATMKHDAVLCAAVGHVAWYTGLWPWCTALCLEAANRLNSTLAMGRKEGDSQGLALSQVAVCEGLVTLASLAGTLGEQLEELLALGLPRSLCATAARAAMRPVLTPLSESPVMAAVALLSGAPRAPPALALRGTGTDAVGVAWSLEDATEWLLEEPAGRLAKDAREQTLQRSMWGRWTAELCRTLGVPVGPRLTAVTAGQAQQLEEVVAEPQHDDDGGVHHDDDGQHEGSGAAKKAAVEGAAVQLPPWTPPPALPGTYTAMTARQAISAHVLRLYPGQTDVTEYTALTKYWLGGPDPLDYVGVYLHPGAPAQRIPPHWHYIGYGLSDLHGDRASHKRHTPVPGRSGFGMEFTFRLAREAHDDAMPPAWPAHVLNTLARYMHNSGVVVQDSDSIPDAVNSGVHGANREKAMSRQEALRALELLPPGDAVRDGAIVAAMLPHAATAPDPDLPPIMTASGRVAFHQLLAVGPGELTVAQHWRTAGLTQLLHDMAPADAGAGGWDALRCQGGGFIPGPLLVSDPRRRAQVLDAPSALATFRAGVMRDGSSLGSMSCCIAWRPRMPGFDLATALGLLTEPGSVLPAVEAITNVEAARQLIVMGHGRLSHAAGFMLQSASPPVQQAEHKDVAAQQSARLGGWGTDALTVAFTTDGADDPHLPQVATAGNPIVVTAPGVVQVYMPPAAAAGVADLLQSDGLLDEAGKLPVTLSWPETVPGFYLTVVRSEGQVWDRLCADVPVESGSGGGARVG